MNQQTLFQPGELPPVSLVEMVRCVEREIKMRVRVYPRFVARGAMTPQRAEYEVKVMTAVLATLQALSRTERGAAND